MAFQSQKNPIITCEQYLWGSGTPTLTCKCKRTLVNLGLEIYDKQPDICLAQKCPTPKLSQRLPPHPHPGTSAIIFTTGNSKVVNSFRGWYLCFEIVVAIRFMKLQNVNWTKQVEAMGVRSSEWRDLQVWVWMTATSRSQFVVSRQSKKKKKKKICLWKFSQTFLTDVVLFLWTCKAISLEFLN